MFRNTIQHKKVTSVLDRLDKLIELMTASEKKGGAVASPPKRRRLTRKTSTDDVIEQSVDYEQKNAWQSKSYVTTGAPLSQRFPAGKTAMKVTLTLKPS